MASSGKVVKPKCVPKSQYDASERIPFMTELRQDIGHAIRLLRRARHTTSVLSCCVVRHDALFESRGVSNASDQAINTWRVERLVEMDRSGASKRYPNAGTTGGCRTRAPVTLTLSSCMTSPPLICDSGLDVIGVRRRTRLSAFRATIAR
jgi:hypothetical protein